MSNWRAITIDDLNAASVSGKVQIIRNAAVARALPDPAPAAIANVTAELRGMIGFSKKYTVDQDVTALPSGLLDLSIKKVIREMAIAVGLSLTEAEQRDETAYESRISKIRTGDWPIDPPDNPAAVAPVQTSVVTPSIQPRRRRCD